MKINTVFLSSYTFIRDGIRTNNSGPVVPMIRFFRNIAESVYLLEQPLPGSDKLEPFITTWNSKRLDRKAVMQRAFLFGKDEKEFDSNKTYFRLKIRDLFSNVWAITKNHMDFRRRPISLFVGVESLNAICGIAFRKLGLVERVVYYIFDWAPDRYPNRVTNFVYLLLDRIAVYYADATWNITYTIAEARKNILNYNERKMSPQINVPYSPEFSEAFVRSEKDVDSDLVVFAGGLIPENGPELLLKAFRIVLKEYPHAKLLVIGGGQQEHELRAHVLRSGLQEAVTFTGFVSDESKVMELQSKGAIGAAPYPNMPGSRKPFGDVIKVRMYFTCGLVTVSTSVPPVSTEISEEGLGIVTSDDSPEEFAKGILELLRDKHQLFAMRLNVLNKARKSTWEYTYRRALSKMAIRLIEPQDNHKALRDTNSLKLK